MSWVLHQRIVMGVPFRGLQSAKKVDCLSKVYSMGSPAPPTTSQTPLGIWSLGLLIQWGVIFFLCCQVPDPLAIILKLG